MSTCNLQAAGESCGGSDVEAHESTLIEKLVDKFKGKCMKEARTGLFV